MFAGCEMIIISKSDPCHNFYLSNFSLKLLGKKVLARCPCFSFGREIISHIVLAGCEMIFIVRLDPFHILSLPIISLKLLVKKVLARCPCFSFGRGVNF